MITVINDIGRFMLDLLDQFGAGRGDERNQLVRFGLAAFFWIVLIVLADQKSSNEESNRNKLLVIGFIIGLLREILMFLVFALVDLGWLHMTDIHLFFPPAEHALSMGAVVIIAAAFVGWARRDCQLRQRFVYIGLILTAICYFAIFLTWPRMLTEDPSLRFGQAYGDWLFRISTASFLVTIILALNRKKIKYRWILQTAFVALFLDEALMIINLARGDTLAAMLAPIRHNLHLWAIPLFGYFFYMENNDEIHSSRENLAATLNSIGDGFIATDQNGLVVNMNPTAEKLCGWMLTDAKGRLLTEVFHIVNAETRTMAEDPARKAYESGNIIGLANHTVLIARDGTEYKIADSAAPIRDRDGKIIGVVLVFRDVTQDYAMQERVRQGEVQYRLLFENMVAGFALHQIINDEKGKPFDCRYITVNSAFERLTGKRSQDLIGRTFREMMPDNEQYWINAISKEAQTGVSAIYHNYAKELGREFDVISFYTKKDRLAVIIDDITERKQAQEALKKRQEALEAVYNISTSLGETFQDICDRVATDLAKILKAPHLMVQTMKEGKIHIISFLSEGRMENNLEASLEGTPCEIVYQKGEPLEINTSLKKLFPEFSLSQRYDLNAYLGVPFKDRSRKVLGLVCVYDYQARIFSREEVHLLDIFAHYLGYEMERVGLENKIRETEKIELLSHVASGVAHEVRNPLHAIQAISEAMAQEIEDRPEYQEYLDHIKVQVNRLSLLMKELLELGKPIQPARYKKENLNELIEAAVIYWREAQPEEQHKIVLDNKLKPDSYVFADSSNIQQVIINLLDNASQHTTDHQEIIVELLPAGEKQATVKVIDRGSGIKPQDLPRMFEPFYTTRKKGTGLGLTLCKRIIESHGGTIEIRNNQGGPGCTVQFTFLLYDGE